MSALDDEFRRLDLIRRGHAARQLHVSLDVLKRQVQAVSVPWLGGIKYGFSRVKLIEIHDQMWRTCPWAARGECEIERKRDETP